MTSFCISLTPSRVRNLFKCIHGSIHSQHVSECVCVRAVASFCTCVIWLVMRALCCAGASLVRRTSSKKRSNSNNIYTQNIILTAHITILFWFHRNVNSHCGPGRTASRRGGHIHQFMRVLWRFFQLKMNVPMAYKTREREKEWANKHGEHHPYF